MSKFNDWNDWNTSVLHRVSKTYALFQDDVTRDVFEISWLELNGLLQFYKNDDLKDEYRLIYDALVNWLVDSGWELNAEPDYELLYDYIEDNTGLNDDSIALVIKTLNGMKWKYLCAMNGVQL